MKKNKTLLRKTMMQFFICTAAIFLLMTPLFYLLTRYFYAEDLIEVIEAAESGTAIPPLDLERDIVAGMMMQFVLTFATLSIALYITVRFITRHLWHPFDDTLRTAELHDITDRRPVEFAPTDIAEFTRLNDTLTRLIRKNREAYRIQKEFTENASHELQTPLAVTRGKLDLLMQEGLSESQLAIVSELYRLNTRMSHLNRNLLLLAKIENAQYDNLEIISLGSFAAALLPSYSALRDNCHVTLDTRTDIKVRANAILLECLLNNLVVNAIRHTTSGDIRVSLGDGGQLQVSNPADNGPLDQTTLFRRFHTDKTHTTGNGLGLSIVKAICDFHGWTITYRYTDRRHHFIVSELR